MVRSTFAIKTLPLTGLVLFSVLLFSSATYFVPAAIVDAQTLAIRFELNQKKISGAPLNPIDLKRIQSGLNEATNTVFEAPHYLEDLGYLHINSGYAALRFPYISRPILNLGAADYRKTLLTRPMAPVAWANLALIDHYLKNDESMWINFELAFKYGAHDPSTQFTLFIICMQRWSSLPDDKRKRIRKIIDSSKGLFKSKINDYLKNHNNVDFN